jgi:hypothetical protein
MQVMGAPLQKASQSNRLALRWAPFGDASFASQIAAIFALSVAIQLAAGWLGLFRADVLSLDYDEHEYWTLSGQILAGLPMELGRRTMLYPLLLAALRRGADNLWFVQSAIAIAAATAAPLLAVLVNKLARSGKAAILAGLGLAIWPAQIFFASSLYSETIALPAFLLFLILLPLDNEGARRAQWWQWAVAGIVLGITAHISSSSRFCLSFCGSTRAALFRRWAGSGWSSRALRWSCCPGRSTSAVSSALRPSCRRMAARRSPVASIRG